MQAGNLFDRLQDRPFTPFRIHLSDGNRLDVTDPGMILVGESSAVLPSVWTKDDEGRRLVKHWRTVAISHIVQMGDIGEPVDNKRRRRK